MYIYIYCHRNQQRKIDYTDYTRKKSEYKYMRLFLIFTWNHFFPVIIKPHFVKTDYMNLNRSQCGCILMLWLTVARKKNQKINNSKYTKIIFKSSIVVLCVFLSYRILSLMVLSRQSLIKITVGVFSKIDVVVVHTPL